MKQDKYLVQYLRDTVTLLDDVHAEPDELFKVGAASSRIERLIELINENEPRMNRKPELQSEPLQKRSPCEKSEPMRLRNPIMPSEPTYRRNPDSLSEPRRKRKPREKSEFYPPMEDNKLEVAHGNKKGQGNRACI